ncbi:MAG: phosphoenolpyruvate--protein phosphotransferase, partial [Acetatifactor sp.]|nr:phosphoenolpyruvate--protein phosphotransferase [Acetatifactor sp.]
MIQRFRGKGVYNAMALGRILLFRKDNTVVERVPVTDTERERERFEQAKAQAARQLEEFYHETLRKAGEDGAAIFRAQQMMLADEDYNDSVYRIIEDQGVNAEYAAAVTADNFAEMFSAMDDEYMMARAADVRDVSGRLVGILRGKSCTGTDSAGTDSPGTDPTGMDSPGMDSREKVILCAADLTPSETAALDRDKILALVTAFGSVNSHTAILARSMNIPAVIGVGGEFMDAVRDGDEAIVDGGTGEIFVNPDEETRAMLLEKQCG